MATSRTGTRPPRQPRICGHPECTGGRFASLEGDRILRIECDADSLPDGTPAARYALDDSSELLPYRGPVRVANAESVIAFCGEEYNLLSHPQRRNELADRARAAAGSAFGTRRPSVLIFMIDATSRAHFRRSMPRTLAALDAVARHGPKAAVAVAAEEAAKAEAANAARAARGADADGSAGAGSSGRSGSSGSRGSSGSSSRQQQQLEQR